MKQKELVRPPSSKKSKLRQLSTIDDAFSSFSSGDDLQDEESEVFDVHTRQLTYKWLEAFSTCQPALVRTS